MVELEKIKLCAKNIVNAINMRLIFKEKGKTF